MPYIPTGCVYGADCVVLPTPAEKGGILNAPLSGNVLRMSEVIGALWPGQILAGGKLGDESCALAMKTGLHIGDIMQRPDFVAGNAALTAECALARLIDGSDRAIFGSEALICGWGRIGKILALRLAEGSGRSLPAAKPAPAAAPCRTPCTALHPSAHAPVPCSR